MKITIPFDLSEKVKEANKGYSLKKCVKKGVMLVGLNSIIGAVINLGVDAPAIAYPIDFLIYAGIHSATVGIPAATQKDDVKYLSKLTLALLIPELGSINVPTEVNNILDSQVYKTEYKTDFKEKKVEQKKYINIPVKNASGESEISVCQEHILGSDQWDLSVGSPTKSKVYTLGTRKTAGK